MSTYLDLDAWPRRAHFHFFRQFDHPHFNLCAPVEVTALKRALAEDGRYSFFIAYHYASLRAANAVAPFRYRLRGERVLIHERVHGGSIVLCEDEHFAFIYFDYDEDFGRFHAGMRAAIERVKTAGDRFEPRDERDDLLHHSALPWVSFTSITHARRHNRDDAVPKIAFGKVYGEGGRQWMPVSVEVHHALMDGLHVGRYFEHLAHLCAEPHAALELKCARP